MKTLLLHLTDLHFQADNNWIEDKIKNIGSSIKNEVNKVEKIYFILSGDITCSGKTPEFKTAYDFLRSLAKFIIQINPKCRFSVAATPGNHDCNFEKDTQIRQNMIKKMSYNTIGDKDQSVIDTCISVQDEFWDFYKEFNSPPQNKLFYLARNKLDSYSICLRIYNTAWMSQKEEKVGNLFYPVKLLESNKDDLDCNINISIFHHPITWFNPNTIENNRKELQEYMEEFSDIIIYGHEHVEEHRKIQNIKTQNETIYLSGEALQTIDSPPKSGFQMILLDLSTKEVEITNYKWSDDHYSRQEAENFILQKKRFGKIKFRISEVFLKRINKISIPLSFERETEVCLSDIYVHPDLEQLEDEIVQNLEYLDSQEIIEKEDRRYTIIEGGNQSGKSSLVYILFQQLIDKGYYPIFIEGSEIKKIDAELLIKKAFLNQYDVQESDFDKFLQIDNSKKVLLIDNLHHIKFNTSILMDLIKEFQNHFYREIITINSAYGILSRIKSELIDFKTYTLKPLGYHKRNELIEKYHRLNVDLFVEDYQVVFEKTKQSFDQVEIVLGNKLMPSYPIFVLSILQVLNYARPLDLKQTSYGYCYQSLIYIALTNRAKIKNKDVDTYFNILTELAFNLFERQLKDISISEFKSFYELYCERYIAPKEDEVIANLLASNILVEEEGYYRFSYGYLFFFLVAKKLSEIIHTKKGKEIISKLFEELHKEENAKILVFIAHHSKDDFFIELATFSSMIPFESYQPITLDKKGDFYKLINDIVNEVSSDVIDASKNPKEERSKMLKERDELEQQRDKYENEEEDKSINEEMLPFYQSFRSMEIVGQIIKNRKGSIDKEKLIEIIYELYLTGFRTVSYFGNFINEAKEDFIESLLERVEELETDREIKKEINDFFQLISLHTCLNIFTKIIHSVGIKDLKKLFDDVAKRIDTPAAILVTFSIKTYYDRMSIRELQKLSKDFSDNPVALFILKARVRSYLYHNFVDYKSKNRIAEALNMKVLPSAVTKRK